MAVKKKLSLDDIGAKADQLRQQKIGMGNYAQIVNDTLVLIRELARNIAEIKQQQAPPKALKKR